ncbi:MAG: protein tyrosine phosphatase-like domain-containing protein [Chitinophagales bacterium]|nr:protein tyrosine phosphatase-like domain-containing protein [Chitinophagales bacterium]
MSKTVKYYLAAYNLVAFLFWGAFGISFLLSLTTNGSWWLDRNTLLLLNIAQGMAILEVIHALLKWVKSPVGSTTAQVASRLLVLVIIDLHHTVMGYPGLGRDVFVFGFMLITFAWTVTELIRYSFYFFTLFDKQPSILLWMRYSFFIVLYPLGVTGEWAILLTPVVITGFVLNAYNVFLIPVAISYIYYFPVLYKYMWKQRKARLN